MRKQFVILSTVFILFALKIQSQAASPLELVQTIPMPAITGHFDHFAVDLKGHRLFVATEDYKTVEVIDVRTGKPIHSIPGVGRAHTVFYRPDLNEIFVTDGDDGSLKIFNGKTYDLTKTVKLLADADGIAYDPATHYLYIENGGKAVHADYSLISIVDTNTGEHVGDIRLEGNEFEVLRLEKSSPKLFIDDREKNRVDVIDREKRTELTNWPITRGTVAVAMAMDEANHRLFVGCRSGDIVVFDSASGREITSVRITKGIDDMVYDLSTKRIYTAASDGAVDVYEQVDPDHYQSIGKISTSPGAKTALLVPELKRYFVAAPQHGNTQAQILVYKVE